MVGSFIGYLSFKSMIHIRQVKLNVQIGYNDVGDGCWRKIFGWQLFKMLLTDFILWKIGHYWSVQGLAGIMGVSDVNNPLGSGVTHFNADFGKEFTFKSLKDFHVHGCNHLLILLSKVYNCKRYCSWEFDKVDFSYLTELWAYPACKRLLRLTWYLTYCCKIWGFRNKDHTFYSREG